MRVSLVQPNFRQGPIGTNAYYLPYSVGVLWTYVMQNETVRQKCQLGEIIFRRDDIDTTADRLQDDDIILFSTYIWNKEYNKALAKAIKERNPLVHCIFGGPEMPYEDPTIFNQFPDADVVVINEGEVILEGLLEAYPIRYGKGGVVYNNGGVAQHQGPGESVRDLVAPSPYTSGFFDVLMAQHTNILWNVTLETNRGCPYQCTFCDWGNMVYSKLRKFPMEKVKEELDWVVEVRTDYLSIADANFGIFAERDAEIMDYLIDSKARTGYPNGLSITWAKNQTEATIDLAKKTADANLAGLTLSFQSTDPIVLKNVKRNNLEMSKARRALDICNQSGISVFSEAILGLPGQTLNSWKETVWDLMRMGQHSSTGFYHAQVLVNAEMYMSQMKEYEIEYSIIPHYFANSDKPDAHVESSMVVSSTKDLTFDDMLDASEFNWFVTTWHQMGYAQMIARYLNAVDGLDYKDFYEVLEHILYEQLSWLEEDRQELRRLTTRMFEGKLIDEERYVGLTPWNLSAMTSFRIQAEDRIDEVMDALAVVIDAYGIDGSLGEDLLAYQRLHVVPYYQTPEYPINRRFTHDIHGVIVGVDSDLDLTFDTNCDLRNISVASFLDNLYFRRRINYGKTIIR